MDERVQKELERAGLELARADDGALVLLGEGMTLRVDFSHLLERAGAGRLNRELLVRAARVKTDGHRPHLVDATAGLGEDSFLLAAAGFDVDLYECNPVIALLLADAVTRARADSRTAAIAERMHVHAQDSITALGLRETSPDVVYLDPMFPERRKSAAVKKKFQLLHLLESPCEDEEAMLAAAIAARPRKVVVKRPIKAPCLAGVKPSYEIRGKAVRYDCIVC